LGESAAVRRASGASKREGKEGKTASKQSPLENKMPAAEPKALFLALSPSERKKDAHDVSTLRGSRR